MNSLLLSEMGIPMLSKDAAANPSCSAGDKPCPSTASLQEFKHQDLMMLNRKSQAAATARCWYGETRGSSSLLSATTKVGVRQHPSQLHTMQTLRSAGLVSCNGWSDTVSHLPRGSREAILHANVLACKKAVAQHPPLR